MNKQTNDARQQHCHTAHGTDRCAVNKFLIKDAKMHTKLLHSVINEFASCFRKNYNNSDNPDVSSLCSLLTCNLKPCNNNNALRCCRLFHIERRKMVAPVAWTCVFHVGDDGACNFSGAMQMARFDK